MKSLTNFTISSTNPCLIVYLIDQSGSMIEKFGNANHSKAQEVANAINDVIYELGLRCIGSGGEIKNRFEVSIIGYGKDNVKAASGWEGQLSGKWVVSIKNIFDYPLGIDKEDKPFWVKPYGENGTPMKSAFQNATNLCRDWINWGNHVDCHPPIVINITDGAATDGGSSNIDLINQVNALKELKTNYGNVIVMNIHISDFQGDKVQFPNVMKSGNDNGALLFSLSSVLDENMVRIARQKMYTLHNDSRAYMFNGNAHYLITFLKIGTP